jgi:hypothetical protein
MPNPEVPEKLSIVTTTSGYSILITTATTNLMQASIIVTTTADPTALVVGMIWLRTDI